MSIKKVNLLIAVAGLHIGGAEVVIRDLTQTIDRRRFNVSVFCLKALGLIGEDLAKNGYDIVALPSSRGSKVDYFSFIKLYKFIRSRRIHIVHTHTTDALADAAVCKLFMPGLKLIHTFHFGNYPHQEKRLMQMECFFSRFVNRLIAVGEVQRKQLKSVYRLKDNRIGKVWNGVQIPSGEDGEKFRESIDAKNRIVIGTISTLIQQKGLPDFLAVAKHFMHLGNKVRFVIIGEGPMRKDLEDMRHAYGLDDIVIITGWVMNASKVALPGFDIFFQPSLWEAMSIAILEAMAAGKAIVATSVGETTHIIENGVDGLLVGPRDIDGMAEALQRLISDEKLRNKLGSVAADNFLNHFTVKHMTQAYEKIYQEMI